MAEIDTNDFVIPVETTLTYNILWKARAKAKIRAAKNGDVIIVRSGMQKAFVHAFITQLGRGKNLKVIKR